MKWFSNLRDGDPSKHTARTHTRNTQMTRLLLLLCANFLFDSAVFRSSFTKNYGSLSSKCIPWLKAVSSDPVCPLTPVSSDPCVL